jgi:hypothetical protein
MARRIFIRLRQQELGSRDRYHRGPCHSCTERGSSVCMVYNRGAVYERDIPPEAPNLSQLPCTAGRAESPWLPPQRIGKLRRAQTGCGALRVGVGRAGSEPWPGAGLAFSRPKHQARRQVARLNRYLQPPGSAAARCCHRSPTNSSSPGEPPTRPESTEPRETTLPDRG